VRIFLSYRRSDVGGHAGRLADALLQRLGANSVFQDVIAIAPGQDFTVELDRALDDSDAVLAVIGPGWLTAATPQGAPRLFEADDYVRLELARALNRNVRVVPVLVGGAALPAAIDLPDELRGLVHRQAVVLHDETWHQDVDGLVQSLRGEPAVPAGQNRRWVVVGAVAAALVVFGAAAWLWGPGIGKAPGTGEGPGSGTGSSNGQQTEPLACPPAEGQGWTRIALTDNPSGKGKTTAGTVVFTVKDARWRAQGEGKWQVILTTSMKNEAQVSYPHASWLYLELTVALRPFNVWCFAPSPELAGPELTSEGRVGFEVTCKPVGFIELVVEGGRIRVSKAGEPGAC
jgi:hypothetical protein